MAVLQKECTQFIRN